MTHTLVAILAPGSAEAEVGRVQRSIFADHGFVSSVALSPLVPVAFLPMREPRRGFLASLEASVSAPYRIRMQGLSWEDGWLYLCVDSGGVWPSLRAAALQALAPGAIEGVEGFFPVREGFFLGCVEATPPERERIRPPLPVGGFTSSALSVIRIDAHAERGEWWRNLSTEIVDEIPLRGRRIS